MSFVSKIFGGGSSKTPSVPSAGENYRDSLEAWLEHAPEVRASNLDDQQADIDALAIMAPQMAEFQLGFEGDYGSQLRDASTAAVNQTRAGDIANIQELGPAFQEAVSAASDPQAEAIRQELGRQIFGELQQGTGMDDQLRREVQQSVRQGQSARGITRGSAPVSAEAFTVGSRGLQLRQQRQQNADNFLRQTAATRPDAAQFISGRGGVQQANPALAPSTNQSQAGSLFNATTQANNTNAQLAFNAQQMNQGGGLSGALGGGLAGFALGGPVGAGLGALGGFL